MPRPCPYAQTDADRRADCCVCVCASSQRTDKSKDGTETEVWSFEREGASASGSLPLEGSNKRIHYALCNRASAPCRVHLQVDRGGRAPTTA